MMTFGSGIVLIGAGRDHWYASVSIATVGNPSLTAAAITFIPRKSAPPGVPSSLMMASSSGVWQYAPLSFCETDTIVAVGFSFRISLTWLIRNCCSEVLLQLQNDETHRGHVRIAEVRVRVCGLMGGVCQCDVKGEQGA